jgi:hypothetical protein
MGLENLKFLLFGDFRKLQLLLFIGLFILGFLINLTFGETQSGRLTSVLKCTCGTAYGLLPPISMLLVLAAAVTFAAGQIFGAETRARATGWATAMIVGAVLGFILAAILPYLVLALAGKQGQSWTDYCYGDILSGTCA